MNVEWELLGTRILNATKPHTCDVCKGAIAVDQDYIRSFYREMNGTGTLIERKHLSCVRPE